MGDLNQWELTQFYIKRISFYNPTIATIKKKPILQIIEILPITEGDEAYERIDMILSDGIYYLHGVLRSYDFRREYPRLQNLMVVKIYGVKHRLKFEGYIEFDFCEVLSRPDYYIGNNILQHYSQTKIQRPLVTHGRAWITDS